MDQQYGPLNEEQRAALELVAQLPAHLRARISSFAVALERLDRLAAPPPTPYSTVVRTLCEVSLRCRALRREARAAPLRVDLSAQELRCVRTAGGRLAALQQALAWLSGRQLLELRVGPAAGAGLDTQGLEVAAWLQAHAAQPGSAVFSRLLVLDLRTSSARIPFASAGKCRAVELAHRLPSLHTLGVAVRMRSPGCGCDEEPVSLACLPARVRHVALVLNWHPLRLPLPRRLESLLLSDQVLDVSLSRLLQAADRVSLSATAGLVWTECNWPREAGAGRAAVHPLAPGAASRVATCLMRLFLDSPARCLEVSGPLLFDQRSQQRVGLDKIGAALVPARRRVDDDACSVAVQRSGDGLARLSIERTTTCTTGGRTPTSRQDEVSRLHWPSWLAACFGGGGASSAKALAMRMLPA
eukprot:scaffold11.g4009.t1